MTSERSFSQGDARDMQIGAAIVRCASGDRTALRVIYDLEAARMIGVAFRILRRRELAEEAVQEAFMRIWRSAGVYDSARGAARTWVYTIVRNQALTMLRSEHRTATEGLVDQHMLDLDDPMARLPDSSALRHCLEKLDAPRRSAVVLAYVYGLSHDELAKRLGAPLGTAKSWTRRGLIALRACLG